MRPIVQLQYHEAENGRRLSIISSSYQKNSQRTQNGIPKRNKFLAEQKKRKESKTIAK